jgi:hypothetical protein
VQGKTYVGKAGLVTDGVRNNGSQDVGKDPGFLVYVARTYIPMVHFLLGFHLTIDSWRPGRDEEGCRLWQSEVEASLESDDESEIEEGKGGEEGAPPRLVLTVPILRDALKVLIQLTEADVCKIKCTLLIISRVLY